MRIVPATAAPAGDWMMLRAALWPSDDHAADVLLENVAGHAGHAALGFVETERVGCFRRPLGARA